MGAGAVAGVAAGAAGQVPGVGGAAVAVLPHHVGQTLALPAGHLAAALALGWTGGIGGAQVVAHTLWRTEKQPLTVSSQFTQWINPTQKNNITKQHSLIHAISMSNDELSSAHFAKLTTSMTSEVPPNWFMI